MELFFLLILVVLMAGALGAGFPVAFALPGAAILSIGAAAAAGALFAGDTAAYFHSGGPSEWLSAGVTNLRGVYWEVERDTLIAIPLFIFMGIMLQRSKIAEDLLVTMAQLFGPVPGGLGISVVFVGALLAATTGIVGATVVAMGLISLPAMLRNGYSKPLATGTIAASGTLGQIIPPSIVLIILADQLASATDQAGTERSNLYKAATGEFSMPSEFGVVSTSAGEMFLGAFVPGILLVLIYMVFILVFATINPKKAPAVPYDGAYDRRFAWNVFLALVPPLTLIFLVLGSIIGGIATVNQAGAIGAAGALIMAGYRLDDSKWAYAPALLFLGALVTIAAVLSWNPINAKQILDANDVLAVWIAGIAVAVILFALAWSAIRTLRIDNTLQGVMTETAKTTSLVFIILLGAALLTAAFRGFGGEDLVRDFLEGLPGGFWTQFIIVMAVIFVLGFFLDFIEIAVVVVPIVAPILLMDPGANITAVWLGVMIGLNIQTSFLTPPFGFALFYLRGVAPRSVKTMEMYQGVIAFITLQLIALGIVGFYPQLVNYLPNRVSLTSETAPPPRNPRLQLCLEDYVWDRIQSGEAGVRDAIAEARTLDVSYLPEGLAEDLTESFDLAERAIARLEDVQVAERTAQEAAVDYRPLHREVRALERDIRRERDEIETLERERMLLQTGEEDRGEEIEARIAELETDIARLEAEIPASWDAAYDAYSALDRAETNARRDYRRAADDAFEPLVEILSVVRDVEALRDLGPRMREFRATLADVDPEAIGDLEDPVTDLRSAVGDVEGASDIRSAVNDARGAIRGRSPDKAEALAAMDEAIALWEADVAWRDRAMAELEPGLAAYRDAVADTIGARQQDRLTEEQALYLSACEANHRDVSLSF